MKMNIKEVGVNFAMENIYLLIKHVENQIFI